MLEECMSVTYKGVLRNKHKAFASVQQIALAESYLMDFWLRWKP